MGAYGDDIRGVEILDVMFIKEQNPIISPLEEFKDLKIMLVSELISSGV